MSFHTIHHRSWFPFVLVGLTLSLLFLVAWVYRQSSSPSAYVDEPSVPAVTEDEYQTAVKNVMAGFLTKLDGSTDDTSRLTVVQSTMDNVLALLVPGPRKDLHLELVMSLGLMRRGLSDEDPTAYAEGRRRLESVLVQYPWLR